jgi:hypothetical protein
VQTNPRIYLDYWGFKPKDATDKAEIAYLTPFFFNIGGSTYLSTLTQYCCIGNPTSTLAGSWSDDTNAVPEKVSDAAARVEANNAAANFNLVNNINATIVIVLPHGHPSTLSGCAYHDFIRGAVMPNMPVTGVVYVVLPYVPDKGIGRCGNQSLGGALDGLGISASHEVVEAMSDPAPSAGMNGGDLGWIDPNAANVSENELSDVCNNIGLATRTFVPGVNYPVETIFSNRAVDPRDNMAGNCVSDGS